MSLIITCQLPYILPFYNSINSEEMQTNHKAIFYYSDLKKEMEFYFTANPNDEYYKKVIKANETFSKCGNVGYYLGPIRELVESEITDTCLEIEISLKGLFRKPLLNQ